MIADLASQMKNRRSRPNSFVEIDLRDRIAVSGYITLGEGGEQVYIEEYRLRVEGKVAEIVETHPTIAAIRKGELDRFGENAVERWFTEEEIRDLIGFTAQFAA